MPYVSNGIDWGISAAELNNTLKASNFFKPAGGVLPSGVLTVGAFTATEQTYTNAAITYSNDVKAFNRQGQRWGAVDSTVSNGCKNIATPRTASGSELNHVIEYEQIVTGDKFDITLIGSAYYECRVYVEYGGKMMRAEANPRTGTITGVVHLPLTFAARGHYRIRVVIAGAVLVGVKSEQSAIIKKSIDRIVAVLEGSDWAESAGFKQASGTSWLCMGLTQYLFEKTGWVWINRTEPTTGWFRNGTATVTTDAASTSGQTRFFSADRQDMAEEDFLDKPLIYAITGSRHDTGSGATGVTNGAMANRVRSILQWMRTKDKYSTIAVFSTVPFTGSGFGSITAAPAVGDNHYKNHQEQVFAVADIKRANFVDLYGPVGAAFIGTGSNGTPADSQQAQLVGVDGINPNDDGTVFWAGLYATAIAEMQVHVMRARRIK